MFIPTKINNPIKTFMTTTTMATGDNTAIIPTFFIMFVGRK
jgi:hypothetical protein